MPLFVCTKCNGIDNTATSGGYWGEDVKLCSECKTGEWHGRFDQRQYAEEVDGPIGSGRCIGKYWGVR